MSDDKEGWIPVVRNGSVLIIDEMDLGRILIRRPSLIRRLMYKLRTIYIDLYIKVMDKIKPGWEYEGLDHLSQQTIAAQPTTKE